MIFHIRIIFVDMPQLNFIMKNIFFVLSRIVNFGKIVY